MRGYSSGVFAKEAHHTRLRLRNWNTSFTPNQPLNLGKLAGGVDMFPVGLNRTMMHACAMSPDVLAMCELIRLGGDVNVADTLGMTPLHLCVLAMTNFRPTPGIPPSIDEGSMSAAEKEEAFGRLAWVARILVEQHARVDIAINGTPLIDVVCGWKDWEIVELLLAHGCRPSPGVYSRLRKAPHKQRLRKMVETVTAGGERPPRVCPCWSGLSLAECHGAGAQPYPLEFMCACGSGKTYERCCRRLGQTIVEKWKGDPGSIVPLYETHVAAAADIRKHWNAVPGMGKIGDDAPLPDISGLSGHLASFFLSQGLVDPAFAYALEQTGGIPQ
ncbi:hypothetical protein HWV62_44494 [Athelia sp. TMB]|nr:hypothetical protein HWV62_44494 [Athelia sp. TMB]